MLEKTLESPLDNKEIKPVNPKGNQPWIFIGRTDTEGEAPILCDAKIQLIGNAPDARKDWEQEENGDGRGWDCWMASPTQWTWDWANSRREWRIRKPGMLQAMGATKSWTQLQHRDWTTITKIEEETKFSERILRAIGLFQSLFKIFDIKDLYRYLHNTWGTDTLTNYKT